MGNEQNIRSAQLLAQQVELDPALQEKIKADPAGAIMDLAREVTKENASRSPLQSDLWIYRIVIGALGSVVILAVVSALILLWTKTAAQSHTDPHVIAVVLSFIFYIMNMLVPIIPAIVIYKLFPEGNLSSTEGVLAGWKIKAAGAWGAYITAFLLGYWGLKANALPLIVAVGGASVWTIDSDFVFCDEHGNEIQDSLDNLEVQPPEVAPWGNQATITVFSQTLNPPETLRVKMQGYNSQTVDLQEVKASDGRIKLTTPIKLTKLSNTLSPTAPLPPPLPAGAGPASLTSNH